MSKLLSAVAIPLSILIALKYFTVYDITSVLRFDVAIIGSLFLIAMQVIAYIRVSGDNQGTTFMGKLIKTVLAIPGILFLINLFYPINVGFDLEIIVALFLFTEGLYALH